MELNIDKGFEKHYNEYRSKEEAAKTKKSLKRQIKELEQSSSSESDSEYEESHQQQFISQCDNIIRQITNKGKSLLEQKTPLFEEILSAKREADTDRPIYAKDLNRKILITSGKDSEAELANIAQSAQIDSEVLLQTTQVPDLPVELLNVSEDEDFFRPSQNPRGPRFLIPAVLPTESILSDEDSNSGETPTCLSEMPSKSIKIDINRDRRQSTVRVSKKTTRSEKRAARKAAKDAELRDRLKRLQNAHGIEMRDRLAKALRHAPQLEGLLSVADVDDDDFNVDEWSARLTELYNQDGAELPEETEKPVFSDDSDIEPLDTVEWSDQENLEEEKVEKDGDQRKAKNKSKKAQKIKETENSILPTNQKSKTKREFFTNLELPDAGKDKRIAAGIVRKSGATEQFCRDKHRDFGSYLKKNFDFLCEDLIRGKDEADDLLCRFKFRTVEKQDFGLDTEEIILADEKELNKWASLKKVVCLRTATEELKDRERYARDSMRDKKRTVLSSLYREESESEPCEEPTENKEAVETTELSKSTRKRLRKKNKIKLNGMENINEKEENEIREENEIIVKNEENKNAKSKDKKKDKKKKSVKEETDEIIPDENQSKIEVQDEKKKKKKRKLNQEETGENINGENVGKHKKAKINENKGEESMDNNEKNKTKEKLENKADIVKNTDVTIKKDENIKKQKTKNKSKKFQVSSVPVLNANRLESLGIKPGYYKHVLMEDQKKQ